jgi:hypothetical protein
MFWLASLTVAEEFSSRPTFRLARARSGIFGAVTPARPTPTHDTPGWWLPSGEIAHRFDGDVRGDDEVLVAITCCTRRSALPE